MTKADRYCTKIYENNVILDPGVDCSRKHISVFISVCLMVFNATFNNISAVHHGGRFYWLRRPEDVEKTT